MCYIPLIRLSERFFRSGDLIETSRLSACWVWDYLVFLEELNWSSCGRDCRVALLLAMTSYAGGDCRVAEFILSSAEGLFAMTNNARQVSSPLQMQGPRNPTYRFF